MRRRPLSIRVRFLIVSVLSVSLALALAGLFLISLFADNLERRIETELAAAVGNLAGAVTFTPDGRIQSPPDGFDPRYSQAYSGYYWQIEDPATAETLRSSSLWDFALSLPQDLPEGETRAFYDLEGPGGTRLHALERRVMIASPLGTRTLRIVAATDRAPLDAASRTFALDIVPYLVGLALFLVAASLLQTLIGLRPLSQLTAGLDRIRERRNGRLEAVLPREFEPVELALNRLLDMQAETLAKARARAGDLAHGLKTPLTVLSNDALTLRERGEMEIAAEIDELVTTMRAHVEREIARSRITANAAMRQSDADLAGALRPVLRTLARAPKGEQLAWRVELPERRPLRIDPHDLGELAGNLLENAAKWAAAEVSVVWRDEASGGALVIEDDGPGVDPERIRTMTGRGVRLDETTPGTGLGLSIVQEICAVYELRLLIENRQTHGLRVTIFFPHIALDPALNQPARRRAVGAASGFPRRG